MSGLSDSLARSLEKVKRELESPTEKSLRSELEVTKEELEQSRSAHRTKCKQYDALVESFKYKVTASDQTNDYIDPKAFSIAAEILQNPYKYSMDFTARLKVSTREFMNSKASEESIIDHIARDLAHRLVEALKDTPYKGPKRALTGTLDAHQGPNAHSFPPHTHDKLSNPFVDVPIATKWHDYFAEVPKNPENPHDLTDRI